MNKMENRQTCIVMFLYFQSLLINKQTGRDRGRFFYYYYPGVTRMGRIRFAVEG